MAHSRQRFVAPTQTLSKYEYAKRICITILCIYILYAKDVVTKIFTAKERNSTCLFASLLLFTAFASMWLYCALFLQRKDLFWYERNERFIHAATIIAVTACALLIAAVWPVFGIATVLYFIDALIIVVHVVGLLPSVRSKII